MLGAVYRLWHFTCSMHYRVPVDSNKEPGQSVGKKVPLGVTQNAAETTATAMSVRFASQSSTYCLS
jgi:hypothetical protein